MSKITLGAWHPVTGAFTSESVSDGHPDKICDQISDAVLEACLARDPAARVAVEAAIKDGDVFVLGEVTTTAVIDVDAIVRDVLAGIGHADGRWGVDPRRVAVHAHLGRQSPEIAAGVDGAGDLGAGDQGMMFGFACDDTPERMPLPIALAHRLMRRHREVRGAAAGGALGPDAKSQVTVRYDAGRAVAIDTIVLSTQHAPELGLAALRELVVEEIVRPCLADRGLESCRILVNPAGTFHQGGPVADAGLTGRKIIVDTYGGFARHGGGAFSGKDPTKVDRSAAYAARHLAGSLLEAHGLSACEVRLSYAIGLAEPIHLHVDVAGADPRALRLDEARLLRALTPGEIIARLSLRGQPYGASAAFGHFGRPEFSWESFSPALVAGVAPGARGDEVV